MSGRIPSPSAAPDDSKMHRGEQGLDRRQFELPLTLEEFVNGSLRQGRIMHTRELPKSIDREVEMLHFAGYRLPDDALLRRQFAARIALKALELSSLGDFRRVDAAVHGRAEAVEVRGCR